MNVQIIEKNGKPEWAVIPYGEYQRLLKEMEMAQDVRDYDEAKLTLANGEELIPSQVTYALLDRENPTRNTGRRWVGKAVGFKVVDSVISPLYC